jgi:murein DD-endopeptidase MepM/ murein hydrolase activator NlpD
MKLLVAAVCFAITTGIFLDSIRVDSFRLDRIAVPFRLVRMQMERPDPQLLMPVQGVPARKIADTWAAQRSGGRRHEGQDIFARRGTPVRSATYGIVVRVGTNRLGGNVVSVMGRGGRLYYYAHLDRYAEGLGAGDSVMPGSVIGYVGNTGNARTTPSHLHFGVYTAAGAMNPLPMLVDRGIS